MELTDAAKTFLGEVGYDPTLGARPLRRAIQRYVEDPLSERLLWKEFRAGEKVIVDAEDDPEAPGRKHITFRSVEGFVPASTELAGTASAE
jgi:ATP-dependent Clp protease ATP-binding subunit ClpC